jgi:two-component system, NarL family, nitrate/nitrite response regulator NarL
MAEPIRVVILDDHQSIVDGYCYRLSNVPEIQIAGTLAYGASVEPFLADNRADVLLLDVNVPTAADNPNPYPILHLIRRLLELYPDLAILVISMHNQRTLIQAVLEAGASGYIVKDDRDSIRQLASVIISIANGGVFFSQQAHQQLVRRQIDPGEANQLLTPRQLEVLSLCSAYPGSTTAELARQLGVENSTVRNLLSSAYVRLNVNNRAAALAKARQAGLILPLMMAPPPDL